MPYLNVLWDKVCDYVVGEGDWPEWSEHCISCASGLELVKSNGGDFPAPAGTKIGDQFILVYVTYSSGNSFGMGSGYVIEVALFNTDESEKAEQLCEEIRKRGDRNSTTFNFEGRTIYTGDWSGYFERITDVEYHPVTVKKNKKK